MAVGPGKYDAECTRARESTGGAVILIVLGGIKGSGFSAQIPSTMLEHTADVLEKVAHEIREDLKRPEAERQW